MASLPDEVFLPEGEYEGEVLTTGQLASAHVANTFALRRANNKLSMLCQAVGRDQKVCQPVLVQVDGES